MSKAKTSKTRFSRKQCLLFLILLALISLFIYVSDEDYLDKFQTTITQINRFYSYKPISIAKNDEISYHNHTAINHSTVNHSVSIEVKVATEVPKVVTEVPKEVISKQEERSVTKEVTVVSEKVNPKKELTKTEVKLKDEFNINVGKMHAACE